MNIRKLLKSDFNQYKQLIDSDIHLDMYNDFLDNVLSDLHFILVVELDNNIIGTGTLFIEQKLTYGGCKMGHIENILIDEMFRGKKYGEIIVTHLLNLAKENGCYRADLNCSSELEQFYKKNNFNQKYLCMNVYFNENFK
jgi:glucosamine-phosphate N-acetyltransferase